MILYLLFHLIFLGDVFLASRAHLPHSFNYCTEDDQIDISLFI